MPMKQIPIAELVIKDMQKRIEIGLERYGKLLTSFNGRSSLQDLYEELLDACMYIKQRIIEDESSRK